MDSQLLNSYLDTIGEFVVDEDKIVTYKSLSKSLGIHVNTAKQLLYTYLSKQRNDSSFPISATYLLAGKLSDGSANITIVNEADLEGAYSKFAEITSEHVYSVQKGKSVKDLKILYGIGKEVQDSASSNVVIKCTKSIIKSPSDSPVKVKKSEVNTGKVENKKGFIPEKQTIDTPEQSKKNESPKKSPLKNSKENVIKSPKKTSPTEKSKTAQDKKHGNAKPNKAGNIANFFANAAQKNLEQSNALKSKNIASNQEKNKTFETPKERVVEKEDENVSKKQKKSTPASGEKTKKKKEGNKRKRIQVFSDSEDNDSSNNEEEQEVEEENSELVVPNSSLEEEKEEPVETAPVNKRKKRKVIDKTVMNDDGYLETRKEIVIETDSEDEPAPVEEKVTSSKADSLQKKPKLGQINEKSKAAVNQTRKQASLLTFFKKN